MRNRSLVLTIFMAWLALSLGCTSGGPEIVPIEGTVTHNGEPVPGLRIYFVPEGRPSWGVSDEKGHFELSYDRGRPGAKVGTHKVWIQDESGNVDPTAAMSGGARPKRNPVAAEVADKYSQKNSTLKIEVKKADRNFQLKL